MLERLLDGPDEEDFLDSAKSTVCRAVNAITLEQMEEKANAEDAARQSKKRRIR